MNEFPRGERIHIWGIKRDQSVADVERKPRRRSAELRVTVKDAAGQTWISSICSNVDQQAQALFPSNSFLCYVSLFDFTLKQQSQTFWLSKFCWSNKLKTVCTSDIAQAACTVKASSCSGIYKSTLQLKGCKHVQECSRRHHSTIFHSFC